MMSQFFRHIESIQAEIESIKDATRVISSLNESMNMATTNKVEREASQTLRDIVNATNSKAKRAKTMLAILEEENKEINAASQKQNATINEPDIRIRENLCNLVSRKFFDEMKAYQQAQIKYKADMKNKVTRQIRYVKPDVTEEEIEIVMRSEYGREKLFQQRVLFGVADPIKSAYANAAGLYQDILLLERGVLQIHQMFLDFSLLVEEQGETIDHIELQVKRAVDYVDAGNVEVEKATNYQKKRRKKLCKFGAVIAIVAGILIAILVLA